MAAFSSVLPSPRHSMPTAQEQANLEDDFSQLISTHQPKQPPPYGKRSGFKPRGPEDFGNGGAFPEIHIAQYPLDMGRKNTSATATSGGSLTLEVDAQGNVRYDAIAHQGHSKNRIVHSQFKDLVPLHERADVDQEKVTSDRPSEEEVVDVMERTRAALEKIVQGKIAAAQPKNVVQGSEKKGPTFIRYTPGQGSQSDAFNSGAKQRIIRMVEMPVDPMDPPKFKHKKIPRGPPSPPAPVLHSPPRKLTAKEQADWVIPPCISNWKNSKGYTIPLDKRLAADGRGLQEVTINDNFAKFSEALFAADRHAREEVRQRNLMSQKLAQKQKEAEEEKLRQLAQKAREERAGIVSQPNNSSRPSAAQMNASSAVVGDYGSSDEESSDEDEDAKARDRDELRRERQKDRERELRMSHMGAETKAKALAREQGRDISEKIALGIAKPTTSKESMYDQRLFNQTEGISSGFKDDDAYNLYDKPLFAGSSASSIYRPKRALDSDLYGGGSSEQIERMIGQDKFGGGSGSHGFQGADKDARRDGPVQFERDTTEGGNGKTADPFGFDQFLGQAKKGKRGTEERETQQTEERSKRHRD